MFVKQLQIWKRLLVVLVAIQTEGKIVSSNSMTAPIRLGAPFQVITGEHISLEFYAAVESGDYAKNYLQSLLHNFLENLQRNLSTSSIFNNAAAKQNAYGMNQYQLGKLNGLADFFQHSSETAQRFAQGAETFFDTSKNESYLLLLKLRQVPTPQRVPSPAVKMHLTDYFGEMEFFHVMFSEIIDQALEYIVDTLRTLQHIFIHYADIQRDMLRKWNFNSSEWCCSTYMDFVQKWSAEIFKCATSNELQVAYDVYATTETYTKHIMRQLEFRIQRLYNCFLFDNYEMRCRFLRDAEHDFEKLFAKLDELQQYFDIKIKRGRVTINRAMRRRRHQNENNHYGKCIPYGFPHIQMMASLKICFDFANLNEIP